MPSKTKKINGMTLIEVLVALAIVSFVFTSLLQMTFDALKRAKILELQDKMRNYATEAVQVVYTAKDTDWNSSFGDSSSAILPPSSIDTLAYIVYTTNKPTLKALTGCTFNHTAQVFQGGTCDDTSPNEPDTAKNKKMFGRVIVRTDDNTDSTTNTPNDASIEVIVACIEGKCDPKTYLPFRLNFQVYRTGAPQ